MTKMFKISSTT